MRVAGGWPGRVVLRAGWAKAEARPWNADIPDAHLRLVRGGSEFLTACAEYLLDRGVSGVASPPLPEVSSGIWLSAGYEPHLVLDLYSRELVGSPPVATRAPSRPSPRTGPASWSWRQRNPARANARPVWPTSAISATWRQGGICRKRSIRSHSIPA